MISTDELSEAIFSELKAFNEKVDKSLKREVNKVTKEVRESLVNHPNLQPGHGAYRTGKYLRGFRVKKVADGEGYIRNKVCNKEYRLTHLIEKGHKAGKKKVQTRAFPHWKDAQDIVDTLPERLIRRLEEK